MYGARYLAYGTCLWSAGDEEVEGFSLESDELPGVTGHRMASQDVAQLGSGPRYFVLGPTIS